MNNLCKLGVEKVTITGGEPTLNPKKLEFTTDLLTKKCLPFYINTNATRNTNLILKIFKNNPYARFVQISLDGLELEHEELRNKKEIFRKTLNNIKNLTANGVKVKIVSMVTNKWIDKEKKIFKLIKELGVNEWLIECPVITGKWILNYKDYETTKNQFIKIFREIINLVRNNNQSSQDFSINQIYEKGGRYDFVDRKLTDPICYHHLGMFSFGPEGISFCTFFGNRFGKSLYKIAPAYYKNIEKFWNNIVNIKLDHRLRNNKYCITCGLFGYCQGGCPGRYQFPQKFIGCDKQSKFLAQIKKFLINKKII